MILRNRGLFAGDLMTAFIFPLFLYLIDSKLLTCT